ncbi:MAG TPA: gluconeogenesis factor YvcK family protein [Pseudomonadales bacterium]
MREAFHQYAVGGPAYMPEVLPAARNPRIVVLGGGNGLSTMLRGLRPLYFPSSIKTPTMAEREALTAIVTVADDGGSTGQLRKAYPMLAPGDIRSCLLALARNQNTLQSLFDFRFNGDVGSHSLGNLILTALAQTEGDFTRAIERASELLDVCGRVLPATSDNVALQALFSDGTQLRGESAITAARKKIERVELVPKRAAALPQAASALVNADTIVLGPGSLYTSIIPTLLVPGIADAIASSRARVILVMNLMTEPGETDTYTPLDFLRALRRHAPGVVVDYVLQNSAPIPSQQRARYDISGATQIVPSSQKLPGFACRPVFRNLFTHEPGAKIRHDSDKLARAILELS